jgi:hypothetical protein
LNGSQGAVNRIVHAGEYRTLADHVGEQEKAEHYRLWIG